MIEIIISDFSGTTDVVGVEILMEAVLEAVQYTNQGSRSWKNNMADVRQFIRNFSGNRQRSTVMSSSTASVSLLSGLEFASLVQSGSNSATLRSAYSAKRTVVSSGSTSRTI